MKIALIAITEKGVRLGEKISSQLKSNHICNVYAFHKYAHEKSIPFSDLSSLTAKIFCQFDAIVFISACGIAVRMIAPHIVSKISDPGVIAVDEQGKYAVALLSGHIGKANYLTKMIAEIIGAEPIITTATDIGNKFSPDSFAIANNLYIGEMDMAKEISAQVVKGNKIGFYSNYTYNNLPKNFFDNNNSECGICISTNEKLMPFEKTLHLIPRNVIIGVGCKKGISYDLFENVILKMLKRFEISLHQISELHTIDIKENEKAILDFCDKYKLKLETYSAKQLMSACGKFSHSEFVFETTGTDNVCERSAVIGGFNLIVPKQAENGVTFATAEKAVSIDFERQII